MEKLLNSSDPMMPKGGRVLVVDDDARNRELLHDLLEGQGLAVTEAESGAAALDRVAQAAPHAILLDVMMPGLDGIEVCRRLKGNPATAAIPVLLVTALQERDDRLNGIEAGANDFLTKPIDTRDVMLRTRNAVYAKQLYDRVQADLEQLRELEQLRDSLTHMIVHDMRSPLMAISGNLELLEENLADRLEAGDLDCLKNAMLASAKLIEMVSSLLDVSRLESGQMPLNREPCDLRQVARESVALLGGLLVATPTEIEEGPPATVSGDIPLMQRVIANLVANAAKYSPPGGPIKIAVQSQPGGVRVSVTDQGPGIPPEHHARIFEKFGQVETGAARKKYSTGLGLTFCKLAVEAHGGRIGVDSVPDHGSTFWFTLPA